MLDVKGATFSYNDKNRYVFKDISFSVNPADVLCILGPNGSGKTTLIRCICHLLQLQSGSISVMGEDIQHISKRDLAREVSYIPQMHNPTFSYSVLEVVLMGRTPYLNQFSSPSKKDIKIAKSAINSVGINHLTERLYTEISGGERQLVLFARALAQQPKILLLDEPTSHLDFGNQIRILKIIKKLANMGLSIVMTSHFPDHAFTVSNTVAIMKDGRFIDIGNPDDVVTEANLKEIYGIDVKIVCVQNGNTETKVCIPLDLADIN